jgi:hypothetical protein
MNERDDIITYGVGAVRLERFWLGLFWSSTLHFKNFFRPPQARSVIATGFLLKPGETRDLPVWLEEENISPGWYRARFDFHGMPEAKKLQHAYSEAIWLP